MSNQRIARLEGDVVNLQAQVQDMAKVVAAVSDDTLRACIVLQEISAAGLLPTLPWNLATLLVELQHAMDAKAKGLVPEDGVSIEDRISSLGQRIAQLREELRHGSTSPANRPTG